MRVMDRPIHLGSARDAERNLGGRDGTLYDREVDRFRESGRGRQRETFDGATPEARLQTLYENSLVVAESSPMGGFGSELPASRGCRQTRQGSVCRSRVGGSKKGNRRRHQSSL